MGTSDRPIRIDPDDKYGPNEIPESAVEETLKVLRTMRSCLVEHMDHEADIIIGRAYRFIEHFARIHNEGLSDANPKTDSSSSVEEREGKNSAPE